MSKTLAVFVAMFLVLWASVASAGTLTVRDSTGFLPQGDLDQLQGDSSAWPFDAHILAERASSPEALEADAHQWVDAPNVVVIAIDPQHHKTIVRFGTGTGVKVGDYDSIAAAGNAHFKTHNVAQGIEAIVNRAIASRAAVAALSTSATPVTVQVQEGLPGGTWLGIGVTAALFTWLCFWLLWRSKKSEEKFKAALDENRLETAELRSRNVEEMTLPRDQRIPRESWPGARRREVRAMARSEPGIAGGPLTRLLVTVVNVGREGTCWIEGADTIEDLETGERTFLLAERP